MQSGCGRPGGPPAAVAALAGILVLAAVAVLGPVVWGCSPRRRRWPTGCWGRGWRTRWGPTSFDGIDLASPLARADAGRVGAGLGMAFQDPLTSLNPALSIGRQLTEAPEVHLGMSLTTRPAARS